MKLRYKLNVLIIGLVLLSIAIPSVIYYRYSHEILKEQVDNYLQLELTKNIYDIDGWIDTQSQGVIIISDIIKEAYAKKDIDQSLLQSYISNNNISDIYIGFTDGTFISGIGWKPDPDYDPRQRPWYIEAMNAGKLNVSNVYNDLTTGQPAVAIGIPLKDKAGAVIGVISEDILLETFYQKIREIELKDNGYAYLMDMEGNILTHRDASLIGKNYNNLITNKQNISLAQNNTGQGTYVYQGKNKIVIYDAMKRTDWILALAVEEEKAYLPLRNLLGILSLAVIGTLLLTIILASLFNKGIIVRLKRLSDASISLSKGEFDTEIEEFGNDEIGDVSKAFNRMKTEIKETIEELNASRTNYEELIENTADAICSVNSSGYLITANSVFLQLFGISSERIEKEQIENLLQQSELGAILQLLGKEVLEKKHLINRKIDNLNEKYYNVTLSPIWDKDKGEVKGITTILHDASDLELSRRNLEWVSHHDFLTGLPNRFQLLEDMDSIILKAKTNQASFAVLFIDVDDFKNINDTLGYAMGDIVLQKVAAMLQEQYKVYRVGADEFAVILDEFDSKEELHPIIERISHSLNHSFELDLNTIYISATIGVVLYPDDFSNRKEMMIRVDAALNYAKKNHRSEVQYYGTSISNELEQRVLLEKGLRKALDNEEFLLYYQPIMNSTTRTIKGFEALIRWRKADGTIMSPGEFMPIAENMVLIHDVGLWVIRQALHDLKQFHEEGNSELTMAVNLSANQIKHLDFCDQVIRIIEEEGIDPHHIEFEITESVLIESLELMVRQFQRLIDMGAKISLDDFGTGYSSLNYLQHFPFQILKIDKTFVDYIRKDMGSRSLVTHIIDIAHGMEMEIVAEGVENELQQEYLLERKCDYLQGYLFSRPIPAAEAHSFIQNNSLKTQTGV